MRYHFQYTTKDIWHFTCFLRHRKGQLKTILLGLFFRCYFWLMIVEFLAFRLDVRNQWAVAPLVVLAVWAASYYRAYRRVRRQLLGVRVALALQDGYFILESCGGRRYSLAGTDAVMVHRNLILIQVEKLPSPVLVMVPCRIFADQNEKLRFLKEIDHQKKMADAALQAQDPGRDAACGTGSPQGAAPGSMPVGPDAVKRWDWRTTVVIILLVGIVAAALWTGARDKTAGIGGVPGEDPRKAPVSLQEQRRVLESLGLQVDEGLVSEVESWMAQNPSAEVYVEDYPYTMLLSNLGSPEYDYDTWKVVSYPDGVYWFDWEAFDIPGCYEDLFLAVEHLSGGEVDFEQIAFNMEGVNQETGSGKIQVSLLCNGTSYSFEVRMRNDWMDERILQEVARILEAEQTEGSLYVCGDNGQGTIVFYRDEAWAEQFQALTGVELYPLQSAKGR